MPLNKNFREISILCIIHTMMTVGISLSFLFYAIGNRSIILRSDEAIPSAVQIKNHNYFQATSAQISHAVLDIA